MHFNVKLQVALDLIDEGLKHIIAGEHDVEGEPWIYDEPGENAWGVDDKERAYSAKEKGRSSATEPRGRQFKAWASPKYLDVLSDKVSRLTGHNILLFVGGNIVDRDRWWAARGTGRLDVKKIQAAKQDLAVRRTGIPREELAQSILVNITGWGGGQDRASPWIILHQVAEALIGGADNTHYAADLGLDTDGMGSSFWEPIAKHFFGKYFPDMQSDTISGTMYKKLFKFQSAQLKGVDEDQELLTEYLWHGARIRINYPDGIGKIDVDGAKNMVVAICTKILDNAVGGTYSNTQQN